MTLPLDILVLDAPGEVAAPIEKERLAESGINARVHHWAQMEPKDREPALARARVILSESHPVDRALLERAAGCWLVGLYQPDPARRPAVDLEAAREFGIYVVTEPSYATEAWAGMVASWIGPAPKRSGAPAQSRLGLVGLGELGRRLADWAEPAGYQVYACDPFVDEDVFIKHHAHRATLEDLMGICGVVSVQVSSSAPTRELISRDALALMPAEARLLLPCSPERVDLDALAESLEKGNLRQAVAGPAWTGANAEMHRLFSLGGFEPGAADALGPGGEWRERRAGICRQVVGLMHAARPAHMLIDPPCPRGILARTGD